MARILSGSASSVSSVLWSNPNVLASEIKSAAVKCTADGVRNPVSCCGDTMMASVITCDAVEFPKCDGIGDQA